MVLLFCDLTVWQITIVAFNAFIKHGWNFMLLRENEITSK